MNKNERRWHDEFIVRMTREGISLVDCEELIRCARKLTLIAERECNGYGHNPNSGEEYKWDLLTLRGESAARWAAMTGGDVYLPRGCALRNDPAQCVNKDGSLANPILPAVPLPFGRDVNRREDWYCIPRQFRDGTRPADDVPTADVMDYARFIPAADVGKLTPAERSGLCVDTYKSEWKDMQAAARTQARIKEIVEGKFYAECSGDPRGAVVKLYPLSMSAEERASSSNSIPVPEK